MTTTTIPRLRSVESRPPAESVVLGLVGILLGDGRKNRGVMSLVAGGRQHVPTCQFGLYVTPESRLTNGEPCSARCQRAHAAITAAEDWLRSVEAPVQLRMEEAG